MNGNGRLEWEDEKKDRKWKELEWEWGMGMEDWNGKKDGVERVKMEMERKIRGVGMGMKDGKENGKLE